MEPEAPPRICKYFLKGTCRFGAECKFSHDVRIEPRRRHHQTRRRGKNTESFEPSTRPADMRVLMEVGYGARQTRLQLQTQDVGVVSGLFCHPEDMSIYVNLLREMETCGIAPDRLWKPWHGGTHLIADDRVRNEGGYFYRDACLTFQNIIRRLEEYFNMDVKATRFNWYRHSSEWKPFHRDLYAYMDEEKAKVQNFTVGVSFGMTRDIAFEDALEPQGHRRVISFPLTNGTTYFFTRDINAHWRHGVPQVTGHTDMDHGRISIIAWGSVRQSEAVA